MSKHPGGRPRLWKSPEELQMKIDKYWEYCQTKDRPMTYAGLAMFIGVDRKTLYNYEERDEFFHTLKNARQKIKAYLEEQLLIKGHSGVIFYAKNYGYTDRREVDASIKSKDFSEALDKFVDKTINDPR